VSLEGLRPVVLLGISMEARRFGLGAVDDGAPDVGLEREMDVHHTEVV